MTNQLKLSIMNSIKGGVQMKEKLHDLIDTIHEERLLRKIYYFILGLKG